MKKTTLFSRGFTLIELLVVIAIIGILAAVVIGSLNDARSGGQTASIQQSMANIRSQAELVYNSNNYSYTTVCSDTRVTTLINASLDVVNGTGGIDTLSPGDATWSETVPSSRVAACISVDRQWAATTPLPDGSFLCVDNTNATRQLALAPSLDEADPVCP